jgi:L-threonylcarbamoyladenylate synthase
VKSDRSKLDKWDDYRMEIILDCTAGTILNAAKALKDGHLVAFPTETVYGLGADATNEKAVSRIYSVKGRPTNHPLIVHISCIDKLDVWATDIPDYAITLAREFWPGPMTLILPRKVIAKDFITGGQNNVGLRVPAQPISLALLRKFEELGGMGVAAPSANRFGAVSPTTAQAVEEELARYFDPADLVLNGGPCSIGIESTIIDCTGSTPTIIRPGFITLQKTIKVLGFEPKKSYSRKKIRSSGSFERHYAPSVEVIINGTAKSGDGFLALSTVETPIGAIRLGAPVDVNEFAKTLYSAFRAADLKKLERLIVIFTEENDISEAVKDRLSKAAYRKSFDIGS